MTRACLLVHLPAIPFEAADLLPQSALASGATALRAEGHGVDILDFGSLEALQRIATPSLRAQARRLIDCTEDAVLWDPSAPETARRETGQLRPLLECARHQRNEQLAAAVSQRKDVDFVAFLARHASDAAECVAAAILLRAAAPGVKLVIFGPFAVDYGAAGLDAIPQLDAVVCGEAELSLPAWATHCNDRAAWHRVPGLNFRDGTQAVETRREYAEDLAGFPWAAYSEESAQAEKKIQIYTVELSRGVPHPGYGAAAPAGMTEAVRSKGPMSLNEEIMAVHMATGTRAFHFAGRGAPVAVQECLAVLLTTHPSDILYSRSAAVSRFDPARMPLLASSGCCALDFQVDSGSQRLLEDFYGNDFGVTPMERALQATRSAGCYTALNFTFPCPQDDRHTAAETLRILQRNRPNAISMRAPRLLPGAPWCARAPEFGFRVMHQRYARWAKSMLLGEGGGSRVTKRGLAAAQLELAYRMRGWPEDEAAQARTALLRAAQGLGVAPKGSALLGLMARLAGCAGEEGGFVLDLERALFSFDTETAGALIGRINANAVVPKNTYALRPFKPMLAAVAN